MTGWDPGRWYRIGGSPCAGKSSLATTLAGRHGLHHLEVPGRRDVRFAGHVKRLAEASGGRVLVVDGPASLERAVTVVERHFALGTASTGG